MKIPFVKFTAAGNDFVMIDNRKGSYHLAWPTLAIKCCNRRFGVGADGLIILEHSDSTDFSMLYYNADGSFGGMCGNGGRCAAYFVMNQIGGNSIGFNALDYHYRATREGDIVRLAMKNPHSLRLDIPLHIQGHELTGYYINTGSPHVIIHVDSIPEIIKKQIVADGIVKLGRMIRYDKAFQPEGANVDFLTLPGDGTIVMRTYERGVEDETMACGTGAVACSVISAVVKNFPSPVQVRTSGGEILTVTFSRKGNNFTDIFLEGTVTKVFDGEIDFDEKGGG